MSSSLVDLSQARALAVTLSAAALTVQLADGRTLTVPLSWYPRLQSGTPAERSGWRLIGGGQGIHWADLDEDISVEDLLAGRKSAESESSLRRWLATR